MEWPDKTKLRDALIDQLSQVMAKTSEAAERTRAGATHAEAKPENDKDTRALEQSYLARGQAMRVEELVEQIQQIRFLSLRRFEPDEPIAIGALVALEVEGSSRMVWLAPHAGGTELVVDGTTVMVVTGGSPLGRALLDRIAGDDFMLQARGQPREHVIVGIR